MAERGRVARPPDGIPMLHLRYRPFWIAASAVLVLGVVWGSLQTSLDADVPQAPLRGVEQGIGGPLVPVPGLADGAHVDQVLAPGPEHEFLGPGIADLLVRPLERPRHVGMADEAEFLAVALHLVEGVLDWFRERGVADIEPYHLMNEDVEFRLPVELRRELALAATQSPDS